MCTKIDEEPFLLPKVHPPAPSGTPHIPRVTACFSRGAQRVDNQRVPCFMVQPQLHHKTRITLSHNLLPATLFPASPTTHSMCNRPGVGFRPVSPGFLAGGLCFVWVPARKGGVLGRRLPFCQGSGPKTGLCGPEIDMGLGASHGKRPH